MFGRKKKNDTDENNIYFIKALGNKKIPLLNLPCFSIIRKEGVPF